MTIVLAAIDDTTSAVAVIHVARAIADLLDASALAIHVREDPDTAEAVSGAHVDIDVRIVDGDPCTEIVRAADDPEVRVVVMGARGEPAGPRPAGHATISVAGRIDKPVVIVPPDPPVPSDGRPIRRVLVPLEGTPESSEAVSAALQLFADAGAELIALHVFDPSTVPPFWDQAGHADHVYAADFESRWCHVPPAGLHLRRGAAPATVIEVADEEGVGLIALGWNQSLAPGHADIVRAALAHTIPVLLVPTPATAAT